jgi:hypothetical protein
MKICIRKGDIMEGLKKKTRRLCGLIGSICLLLFAAKVYADDCYIEVQLEDLKNKYSDWEGVTLALYDVGDVSADGAVTISPVYGISEYPQTAEDSHRAALQIEKKLTGEPLMKGKTDAEGKLVFSGLDRGVYFIKAVDSSEYGTITPSLLHLPYYEIIDDVKKGPLFNIKVKPKGALPGQPSVSPETTPRPSVTPAEPVHSGGGVPEKHSDAQKINGAKTGDKSQIAGFVILLGMSAAAAGIVIWKRRKVSE